MPETPHKRKHRRSFESERRSNELYGQTTFNEDSSPLRSDAPGSSNPSGIIEERKTVVHEKRSISHEKRKHSSDDKRSNSKYIPSVRQGGEQKHKTASPKHNQRHASPINQPPKSNQRRVSNQHHIPNQRRMSSDSDQLEHRRKVIMCVVISVAVGVVIGSLIGYGAYLWITSVQQSNFEINPNRNSQLEDSFNIPSTTLSFDEKNNLDTNLDVYNSNPDPSLDAKVGINSAGCGQLAPGVDNLYENNPSGRKKRQIYGHERVGRIVGGHLAQIDHHPWQVSLWTTSHTCGGSIIASNWILFAAHCTIPYPFARNWTVHVGESDRRYMAERGQVAKATDLIVHESFDEDTFDNDLALLRLNKHLTLNDKVQTICLPSSHRKPEPDTICYISGWGANAEDDVKLPHRLQYTRVTIIRTDVCNGDDWLMGMVSNNMFCAGTEDGSRDACQGDSGGPLTCYDPQDRRSYVMGIVSWGIGCGEPLMPGVYSNLPRYLGWIREAMRRVEARYFPLPSPSSR